MNTPLRVLNVEDSATDAELTIWNLQESGFDVTSERVESAEAMRLALQQQSWDVILCDFSLPIFSADAALAILHESGLDLPFIVVSGAIGDESAIELMRTGAHDYLMKNHLARLASAVRRELQAAVERQERRQAQKALCESESRFRSLANNGRALIWTSGTDKLCDYFNQPWLDFTGRTLEQELSEGWTSGVHPQDLDGCSASYLAAFDRREKFSIIYRLRRSDGAYRWMIDEGAPRYDMQGSFIGYIGHLLDITEMKLAEDQLRLAACVFENTGEGIAITDAAGIIVSVNQAFEKITGYGKTEAVGQSHRLLQSGRHETGFFRRMWACLIDMGHWRGEIWNRRHDGEIYPGWVSIDAVTDEKGTTTGYVSVFSDLSEIKDARKQVAFLAHHDPLTRLPNRALLNDRLQQAIDAARYGHGQIAVLLLDVDRLGRINDSFGYDTGDTLLAELGKRLLSVVAINTDTVACLGGDEFALVLTKFDDIEEVMATARRMIDEVAKPLQVKEHSLMVTASIGVSLYPEDGATPSDLLKCADVALSHVKNAGRNGFRFFTAEMHTRVLRWMSLENLLRHAIERNELILLYQPQVSLVSGTICGMEALIRWHSPALGLISPADFIPIAEDTGLIVAIGEWVIRSACAQSMAWQDAGSAPLPIAVNISARQVETGTLLAVVQKVLIETGLQARYLELELTESVMMGETEATLRQFADLRSIGIAFSLDDFGTGYSSLAYLSRFSLQKLKIDQSFVRNITTDPKSAAIAQATIALAHGLGITVIAEGVETEDQMRHLRNAGCDELQGYFFSRPVPPDELADMLKQNKTLNLDRAAKGLTGAAPPMRWVPP